MNIAVKFPAAAPVPTANYYEVVGDESLPDWNYQSRTLTVLKADGSLFNQLPSVMRYDKYPQPNVNDWRVDETWLRDEYIRINNYDGDGIRRCDNYLWKDDTALYNNKGFPYRQYLTMSRNLLQEVEWVTAVGGARYLKFKTLQPGNSTLGMTNAMHPQYVHRFDLVGHKADGTTYHTWNTPRGFVYFFLTSVDGYAWLPERFVRKV